MFSIFFRSVVNPALIGYAERMARPRQYDPETALDAARDAFWSKGYSATSMADLCAATGMKKGSLYQAFGDKHALFMTVLDRYLEAGAQRHDGMLERPGVEVPAALADWLRASAEGACSGGGGPGGCMAVNIRLELAPHDPVVRARIERHFARMRATLVAGLRRGQAAGVIRRDQSADEMARYLEVVVVGLANIGRAGQASAVEAQVQLAVDALRADGGAARQASASA